MVRAELVYNPYLLETEVLFDGNPPFTGRGAVSFAMNVAEMLRLLKQLSKYNM